MGSAGRLKVHLLDGTYELFRHFFAVPKKQNASGEEVGAVRAVVGSVLGMIEGGTTHIGVATDHVIESFRNEMWPGYKTGAGIDERLLSQFGLLEDALRAMGVVVWAMTELEADDALASAAAVAAKDQRVEQVLICTPDKDVAQCVVGKHIVQFDRRKRELRDEAGVVTRFGVKPSSIPDYLALTGDSADGFPGLPGWGSKSASVVLAHYEHIENIPERGRDWAIPLRSADTLAKTLRENHEAALLFRDLATLRIDGSLLASVDDLRWRGPEPSFGSLCDRIEAPELATRAQTLARGVDAR